MTMDTIEAIMTTRAIRRFSDEPVDDDDIATCLRAAQQAPSGGNVQPQQYIVLTEPAAEGGHRSVVPRRVRPLRAFAPRAERVPRRGAGCVMATHARRQPASRRSSRRRARDRAVPPAPHPMDPARRRRCDGHWPARRKRLSGGAELLRRRPLTRARYGAHDGDPHPHRRSARRARRAGGTGRLGAVRDRRARPCRMAGGQVRGGAPQAGVRRDALEPLGREATR